MADLTILSPASLPPFTSAFRPATENTSKQPVTHGRGVSPAITFTFTEATSDGVPAAQIATRSELQHDPLLLSPPRPFTKRKRRVSAPAQVQSPSLPSPNSEDDTLEDQPSDDPAVRLYTRSFRPFTHPSTPNLLGFGEKDTSDLPRPPPPLFRPKTFWKNTRRSALTGPSYSPSSYIVRRSTFIAAGLTFDTPRADLSALGVELRPRISSMKAKADRSGVNSASSTPSGVVEYGRRQDAADPMSPTSTYDYWWPYPPQVPTTDATQDAGISTTDTFTSMTSSTITTPAESDVSMSSNSDIFSINASNPSVVRITALPPLPSSSIRHPQSPLKTSFNPLLLTPIFIVIGVILGTLCGNWLYGAWRNGNFCSRNSNTLAGPRYASVNHEDMNHDGLISSNETVEKAVSFRINAKDEHASPGAGLLRSPSAGIWSRLLQPSLSLNDAARRYTPVSNCDHGDLDSESQTRGSNNRKYALRLEDRALSPSEPSEYTSGTSMKDNGSDKEDEEFYALARNIVPSSPAELTRHKSIRQRILEKIQQGFSPRTRHGKSRSRGTPQLEEGLLTPNEKRAADNSIDGQTSLKRIKSKLGSARYSRHGRATSDYSVSDIQTPGKAHVSLHGVRGRSIERIASGESFSPRKRVEDKFTALPERRVRASRTRSGHSSPTKSAYLREPVTPLRRADSDAVLPSSPPLLESPHLNSTLFFDSKNATPTSLMLQSPEDESPILHMKSQRKLVKSGKACSETSPFGRMTSKHGEIKHSRLPTRRAPSGPRQANRQKSPRKDISLHPDADTLSPSSRLESMKDKPLPSTPPRDRSQSTRAQPCTSPPVRTGSKTSAAGSTTQTSLGSRGLVHSPSSPKERFEARHSALDRVSAIVSRSYSVRDLKGIQRPSSPTMFGADTGDLSVDRLLPSIEHRLVG